MKAKFFTKVLLMLLVVCLVAGSSIGCGTKQYEITYNLNYEGAPTSSTVKLDSGSAITEVPTREGYTFEGWFTDAACATAIGADYKVSEKATLYAKWTAKLQDYYLGGSFNGYKVPNTDSDYKFSLMKDSTTVYYITVNFTAEMRDPTYDGHWYKISKGSWNAEDVIGVDNYFIQPAPVKYTAANEAVGLGSIWIDGNGSYTIVYDSENNIIYDTYASAKTVRIYGDFNSETNRGSDWSILPDEALSLTDADENGIWEGELTLPAYTGTGDGYQLNVLTKYGFGFYPPWFGLSAIEQYLFDGKAGGMGVASYLKPTVETTYHFYFDASTNKTDYTFNLATPTLYGDFNSWNIFDTNTATTKQDNGKYTATITLPAYTGDGDGWTFILCESARYYSAWDATGADRQYLFDGTAAGMGGSTYIKNAKDTTYLFTYDPTTHITTYVAK